jgi:HEAT repeat protein
MIAGDFVTIGIEARSPWERRLETLLALVTELFASAEAAAAPQRTRDELLDEAGLIASGPRPTELHLLDPDDADHQADLVAALDATDPRVRRVAVAVLAESSDAGLRLEALHRGLADDSRTVRRTSVDAAADAGDEALRPVFEGVLDDGDPWIRWKAVRALGDLGPEPSRTALESMTEDPDFQVRFEATRVLRGADSGRAARSDPAEGGADGR